MALIRPAPMFLPRPELVARLACPPYDVVTAAEARQLAQGNPCSFLRVVRAEIDLPENTPPYDERVYRCARENFASFIRAGWLYASPGPVLFIYRLETAEHAQTGVVACCSVEEYDRGVICKHENTRPDKEQDRVQHMLALSAHAEAVLIAYRGRDEINALVAAACRLPPLLDFRAPDGVQHTLWQVQQPMALVRAFAAVPRLYIADGHHRSAGASRVCARLRELHAAHTGGEEYNFFPATLFPAEQLRILPYHRVLRGLAGWQPHEFLQQLRRDFLVTDNAPPSPLRKGEISLYVNGNWHGLTLKPATSATPTAELDVTRLQEQILAPYFGIHDQRTDTRLEFVGGARGVATLQQMVDSGTAQMAISMHATPLEELLRVSDAGALMPPKSTWFEPKLRSGLFVHPF
ncbi:MAG: DUF1015 family protein [candidate division KSB1 bacterium]|nr:DUF1015 family protein [candidate division KSB1 bacterium]MDZ7276435.1 DUF1015 family protein [candidate division KSB1 bacterium]MDZ7288105.1 DUF1015 family protein [candidate division KSB1 bacterium]MDZ7300206.1 DUF1015 family protein [candidate division KSB1 bacterium]MDZ7305777.1 DUF1015 family protein [candidate division KSB1 bacterium]